MVYLLKVTIAWALFLLLFEAFYQRNRRFTANRLYLLLSMALGLLLPLIPLPSATPPAMVSVIQNLQPAVTTATEAAVSATPGNTDVPAITAQVSNLASWDIYSVLGFLYWTGVVLLFLRSLADICQVLLLIAGKQVKVVHGHKVIATGKDHSPYSFMGLVFLADPGIYSPQELLYIIQHEAAHNQRKHWLDLWIMQLTCILCWFHPLIWRYRYLLQMQHEYEADEAAARNDTYNYGHFLLQQALLKGVPSMTHSFHFSPIKNRVHMLTRKHHVKSGSWKYLLIAPVLFSCTFLMAKAGDDAENTARPKEMTYQGNTFKWRGTDTVFYDRQTKQARLASANARAKKQIIFSMNGAPVYRNELLSSPANYGTTERAYADMLGKEFLKMCRNTADSQAVAFLRNVVISKEGKVVYFEASYGKPFDPNQGFVWNPFPGRDPWLNSLMEKIIRQAPNWKPATINGQPVNSLISFENGAVDGC